MAKGIIHDHPVISQTPHSPAYGPSVGWRPEAFNHLIQSQGYEALIDRALRCPCSEKSTGHALSTCKNCLGRGWLFVNRFETMVVAQRMDNKKHFEQWGEINRGTASITTKGVDKIGFMDRITLTQLEAYYSEVVRPRLLDEELVAYPVYEPLEVHEVYLFVSDNKALKPLKNDEYEVVGNKIRFSKTLLDEVESNDLNKVEEISITIRYTHHPVYHVIDSNRELMRVRRSKACSYNKQELTDMPINVLARKAHFIFDSQKHGMELIENSTPHVD